MPNNSSISVVIPTYNREKDLIVAIKSVLNQTYPVSEIVVCDDGSTDKSKDLVLELNEPRVKWIDCGRNGRPAIPRNIGISNSSSEWIAFLDSDDEWFQNKIENQLKLAETLNCKAVCSNAIRIAKGLENTNYLSFSNPIISFKDLVKTNFVICSSMLVHRSLFSDIKGFPEPIEFKAIEDYALWLKIATLTDIAYSSEPLLNYLDIPSVSIRSHDKSEKEQRQIIFVELLKWISDGNLKNKSEFMDLVETALGKPESTATKIKNKVKKIFRK